MSKLLILVQCHNCIYKTEAILVYKFKKVKISFYKKYVQILNLLFDDWKKKVHVQM